MQYIIEYTRYREGAGSTRMPLEDLPMWLAENFGVSVTSIMPDDLVEYKKLREVHKDAVKRYALLNG